MAFGYGTSNPLLDTLENILSSATQPIIDTITSPIETAKAALSFAQTHPHVMVATGIVGVGLYTAHKKGYLKLEGLTFPSAKLRGQVDLLLGRGNFDIELGTPRNSLPSLPKKTN
jgi:hypothetical protein